MTATARISAAGPARLGCHRATAAHLLQAAQRPVGRHRDRLPPDYAQFFEDGIAFGGLFTGAEDIKTEEQAQRYGGTAGQSFDQCYHTPCDNLGNISIEALELHGDALAFATSWLSLSTKMIDDEIAAAAEQSIGTMRIQQVQEKSRWGHWIR